MKYLMIGAAALALTACAQEATDTDETASSTQPAAETADAADDNSNAESASALLEGVLDAQSDEAKARYQYRHPKETLEFIGVKPGMTVVDTLPGDPWYSGILSEYLGPDGLVVGANYDPAMRAAMGGRSATDEYQAEYATWQETWVSEREADRKDGEAPFAAMYYGAVPDDLVGAVDVVMMVRAAHHWNRIEDGRFFTAAAADASAMLKPGGIVGVVQHRAPEDASDAWADGSNGYLKQSLVVWVFENAGFELLDASEINANPKDQPSEEDFVWRLLPRLAGNDDNPERKAEMEAIGESDRMTLKFRKSD